MSGPINIFGASLHRSGLHYLVYLLSVALEGRFAQCVTGQNEEPPRADILFWKGHDVDLNVQPDRDDVLYVIQHREPRGRVLSLAALSAKRGHPLPIDDRDYIVYWLAKQAIYTCGFYVRWLAKPKANGVVIDYAELTSDPVHQVALICSKLGIELDDKIRKHLAKRATVEAAPPGVHRKKPYVSRDLTKSDVIPLDLLSEYEAIVRDGCPGARWQILEPLGKPSEEIAAIFGRMLGLEYNDLDFAECWAQGDSETENPYYLRDLGDRLHSLKAFEAEARLWQKLIARNFKTEAITRRLERCSHRLRAAQ